jgi:hypothetical protein
MALGLIHRPRAVALVALAAAALALAGCTSPTPYEPAGDSNFGYSELRLEDNRYRVTFAGNTATPRSTVDNYVLYRAAELTVANGYNYFQLVSKDTDKAVDRPLIVPSVGVFGGSRWGRFGGWYRHQPRPGQRAGEALYHDRKRAHVQRGQALWQRLGL